MAKTVMVKIDGALAMAVLTTSSQVDLFTPEFESPPLEAGEVAVKVKAASINPFDWKIRRGYMKMMTGRTFPRAMSMDFSGTV